MHNTRKITSDMYWVGGNDRRIPLFENIYPVSEGVSYNSYLVIDEKTVLLDTVDKAVADVFFENVAHVLNGRPLDYVIVNHMEPDHCATLADLVMRYPDVKIVGNVKTFALISQFFGFDTDSRAVVVKEGDTLETGRHTFTFIMAPMVHWPEAMVTYDMTDKVLYSADAFGSFGAVNGNIFADEVDFEHEKLAEARRYYTNIVGKYGASVNTLLKKASGVEIKYICPLHGLIWRENICWFVDKYLKWASYEPEDDGVLIVYGSIYGNTANAAEITASKLAEKGVKNIAVYDASVTHPSVIVSEAFRFSRIVFASSTYNAGIFTPMETVLLDLKAHALKNRTVAVIENGSWAISAGKLMKEILSSMQGFNIVEPQVTLKSTLKDSQLDELEALCCALMGSDAV